MADDPYAALIPKAKASSDPYAALVPKKKVDDPYAALIPASKRASSAAAVVPMPTVGHTRPASPEIARDAKGQPKRDNPLRTISDVLETGLALPDAYLRDQPNLRDDLSGHGHHDNFTKALKLIQSGKFRELAEEYGAGSRPELEAEAAHGSRLAQAQLDHPVLNAVVTGGEEFLNPANLLTGEVLGNAMRIAGAARAIPAIDRAATAVENVTTKPLARAATAVANRTTRPVARAVGGAVRHAANTAADAASKIKPLSAPIAGLRAGISRYAALRDRGGTPYVAAAVAAQAAPEHAAAAVQRETNARFGGLTREQKIEVQRLSYRDEDGNPLVQNAPAIPKAGDVVPFAGEERTVASSTTVTIGDRQRTMVKFRGDPQEHEWIPPDAPRRNPNVPEPKKGPSLQARADGVRDDFLRDDALLNQLGIRTEDQGELYDSNRFFPMRKYGDRPVYAQNEPETAPPLAPGEVPAVDAQGRVVRRRGAFSSGVTKGGSKVKDTILGSEDELHPEYDPAHQYQQARTENARAIANEQARRALEDVPLVDSKSGAPKWWVAPGTTDAVDLKARVPLQYAIDRGGTPIHLGEGEEGAKGLKRYIDAVSRAKANSAARSDPQIQALARIRGVDINDLGTRRVVARDMAPYDARTAAMGRGQIQLSKTAQKATADVQRNAVRRAKELAQVIGRLDKTKQALVMGNDALGAALRENGAIREALASSVAGHRAAAEDVLRELGETRAAINAQKPGNVRGVASEMAEAEHAGQKPFWDALAQVGGKIVPDVVWDAGKKKFVLAGEFADISRGLLSPIKAIPKPEEAARAKGNLDEITAIVRNTHPEITDDEVREFFARNPRPPKPGDFTADARDRIVSEILPRYRNAGADDIERLRDELRAARQGRTIAAATQRGANAATGSLARAVAQMRTAAARATGASGSIESAADALRGAGQVTGGETAALARIGALSARQRRELEALRKAAEIVRGRGEVAETFRRVRDRYYGEIYDSVKRNVEAHAVKTPEGYVRESSLGLASPSGREMALDDSFAKFFKGAERLSPEDGERAKGFWNAMQVINRFARASIVLTPQVHGINNLGMHYLAEGGDPARMAQILAGKAKFDPDVEARAMRAGAYNGSGMRSFGAIGGGSDAHAMTTDAGELSREIGAKAGPLAKVATPLARAGIALDRHVYMPMNEWLFGNAERGYAIDLFERFTKGGKMTDGEAAIRVRNALGKYGDLSPREIAANLDRIFYFYPWMKTVVPFWVKQGMIAPQWWDAPVRGVEENNEQQGYDDPSRPFTATLGKRANGDFRRVTLPIPQRVLENVAEGARLPVDLARGDFAGAREDAAAPINYVRGHASLPFSLFLDAVQAAEMGGRSALPRSNAFATDPNASAWQNAATLGGNLGDKLFAPLGTAERGTQDPGGAAASYATGAFSYGVEPAAKKKAEHEVRVAFEPLIKAAKEARNDNALARLIRERDAALARIDRRFAVP